MTEPLALHAAEETLDAVHAKRHDTYPAYKPSGVEWLGDVPEHWEVKRLKWSSLDRKGGVWGEEPGDEETGIICVRVADFDRTSLRVRIENPTLRSIPTKDLRGRLLKSGDLLLEKSGGGEKQLVGAVMLFDHDVQAVNSNFVARMTPSPGFDSHFLAYLHSWLYSSRINFRSIKQTTGIQNLDVDAYLSESVAFPPLEEQRAIARFLDEETRKMDDLISAKRGLLDLLKEKRQAVITHAVTRGLDPAAKLKPSGVEWLGDVPERWDVKPLKYVASIKSGENITHESIDSIGNYPVYGGNGVRGYTSEYTHDGDFVLIGRQGALCGNVHAASGRIWASEHCAVATPKKVSVRWLRNLVEVMNLRQYSETAAQPGLAVERVLRLRVPCPSIAEQRTIAHFLDDETKKMDDLESVVREAIASLEVLRTSIISAAVTGKIDVRGATVQTKP